MTQAYSVQRIARREIVVKTPMAYTLYAIRYTRGFL